jgi:hypothetical protein
MKQLQHGKKKRQMKHLKHTSKTLAKTPETLENHCKHSDETLTTDA